MKKIIVCLVLFLFIFQYTVSSQENTAEEKNIYATLNALAGIAVQDYKENSSKDVLMGVSFDVTTVPFKKFRPWELGGQFEFLHAGTKKDEWSGLELKSKSMFYKLNLINRIRPIKKGPVDPFIELAYGVNMSYTKSSYEIVDETTFLEEFLLNAEDVGETETVKKQTGFSQNFAFGVGAVIKHFVFQVKYNYCPNIKHVKKEDIHVVDDEIVYDSSKSKLQLVTVCLEVYF